MCVDKDSICILGMEVMKGHDSKNGRSFEGRNVDVISFWQ